MKTSKFFAVAMTALAVVFTACEGEGGKNPDFNALPNGFYVSVVGQDLVEENAMDQGINEVDQTARTGMYEKYIVLEAGKSYEFVNKKGENADHYGATLTYGENLIVTDNHEIAGYQGSLVADQIVEVTETGLYHIVLDFNEDDALSDVGGPQCIIVPADFGVRGAMNGWGFTLADKFEDNVFVWENVKVESAGAFKFAHGDAWKINLDIANLVKANTNLGVGCIPGGADIDIERGVFTITLKFVGPAATTVESFEFEVNKTADLEDTPFDESRTYSFIGTINGNWDNDTDFVLESSNGNHYVYSATGLDFAAGEFKVRVNHDWGTSFGYGITVNGLTVSDNGGNMVTDAPFKGSAKFEFDWDNAETNIVLTFIAE